MVNIEKEKGGKNCEEDDVYVYQANFWNLRNLQCDHFPSQEPLQLINNVKELLALQTDAHNRQPFQAQESLHKSLNDQLARKKVQETSSNNLSLEDEDYDHLNYTRTVNELSPNYIKLNNDK